MKIAGERAIARERVEEVFLQPARPPPAAGVIEALRDADLVVLSPGSLYSSVVAGLLVDGVADALVHSRALKVMVQNVMTQPGETDGMTASEHVRVVQQHAGPRAVDVLLTGGRRVRHCPARLARALAFLAAREED